MFVSQYRDSHCIVATTDRCSARSVEFMLGPITYTFTVQHEPTELRVVGQDVVVNNRRIQHDGARLLNDGRQPIYDTIGASEALRIASPRCVLSSDGELTVGDDHYYDVYDYIQEDRLFGCMISCDGELTLLYSGAISSLNGSYIKVPVPRSSVFAGYYRSLLYSVSNFRELSFCDWKVQDWITLPVERYGSVHEIGTLYGKHDKPVTIVILDNGGVTEGRRLMLDEDSECSVSEVLFTGVYSISSLRRPRYKPLSIKSAQSTG